MDAAAVATANIADLREWFRRYGYCVTMTPVSGMEAEHAEELRRGLAKVEDAFHHVHKLYKTRGRSKRALTILHQDLPEPIWGVRVKVAK